MIKIVIMHRNDNKIAGFLLKGHSGAGVRGTDIICSAVSALAQSTALSLREHLHSHIYYDAKPGYLKLNLEDLPNELTEAVFSVAVLGFTEIAKKYPKYVNILNKQGVN
ncbi:ribosomal-processing cysteine protease Prp [Pectinatus sottacetonis]|uniref:ribosomal-processing cysteine protease Prp n=1 Tax=Pectinatus sottacetonis TaxID=1002795 RepID=UPI0018C72067|nr:ribosomal-processing cysteine protease Prp [Pectinatus sottacetonis]